MRSPGSSTTTPALAGFTGSAPPRYTLATPTGGTSPSPPATRRCSARPPPTSRLPTRRFPRGVVTVNGVAAVARRATTAWRVAVGLHRRAFRTRSLNVDARAGPARRGRLLGLRRPTRRHPRSERSGDRLLPLVLTGVDNVGNSTTTSVDASAAPAGALGLQRRACAAAPRPSTAPPAQARSTSPRARRVRRSELCLPGARRFRRLGARGARSSGDTNQTQRHQSLWPGQGAAQLDASQLHPHLRLDRAGQWRPDGQHRSASRWRHAELRQQRTSRIGTRTAHADAASGLASSTLTRRAA